MSRLKVGRSKEYAEACRKAKYLEGDLLGGRMTNHQFVILFEELLVKYPAFMTESTLHAYFTAKFETARGEIKSEWFWWQSFLKG